MLLTVLLNDCITFSCVLVLLLTRFDWLFIFAIRRRCCCHWCCFNRVRVILEISFRLLPSFLYPNGTDNGAFDWDGSIAPWKCFCGLLHLFWLYFMGVLFLSSFRFIIFSLNVTSCNAKFGFNNGIIFRSIASSCLLNGPLLYFYSVLRAFMSIYWFYWYKILF